MNTVTLSDTGQAIVVLERELRLANEEVREKFRKHQKAVEELSRAVKTRDAVEETFRRLALVAARSAL